MNNDKNAFGCTTFRKGNFFGRSYDYYCNDIASSVLHTGRIKGVRYESIGMSGSSFNGMRIDKAIDGTIDKSTMNKLFSSIVDGINEKGVAISALVVPRGDKGLTTGTNPGKSTVTAKMVPRLVLDKAPSAKDAIKLLSEMNIVQDWSPEFELHWMIADKKDTYIVETVDNKLSYLGPEAIEGIENFYSGTLEANVITNFYQTGFDSSIEDVSSFSMPITNPTVTPHGCGLERYKVVRDKLEQINGDLANDKEAMGIINLVQYTNAYKMDNDWYTEFANHEYDNRSPLVTKGLGPSGKLGEAVYTDGDTTYHEVFPPKDESYFNFSHYDTLGFNICSESLKDAMYIYYGCTAHTGDFWNEMVEGFTFDESKWYIENGSAPGIKFIPLDKTDVVYRKYEWYDGSNHQIIGDLIYGESEVPSDYVVEVNELRETYNAIVAEGGKDAVRKLGLAWHSNHQCVYDLANKRMLVYPSENGEVAYRVDIHGKVEDEAVEIEIPGDEDKDAWGYPLADRNYNLHYRISVPDELKDKELMIGTNALDFNLNVTTGAKIKIPNGVTLVDKDEYYASFSTLTAFGKPSEWWFAYCDEDTGDIVNTDYKVEVPSDEPKLTIETTTVTFDKSKMITPSGAEDPVMVVPFPYKQGYSAYIQYEGIYFKETQESFIVSKPCSAFPNFEHSPFTNDCLLTYEEEPTDGSKFHYLFANIETQKFGYFDDNGEFIEIE